MIACVKLWETFGCCIQKWHLYFLCIIGKSLSFWVTIFCLNELWSVTAHIFPNGQLPCFFLFVCLFCVSSQAVALGHLHSKMMYKAIYLLQYAYDILRSSSHMSAISAKSAVVFSENILLTRLCAVAASTLFLSLLAACFSGAIAIGFGSKA